MQKINEFILSLKEFPEKLTLKNLKKCASISYQPKAIIQVGGSKGKSSTAYLISFLLNKNQASTGLFISPNIGIQSYGILINNKPVKKYILKKIFKGLILNKNINKLTQFEFLTLMAIKVFEYYKVDFFVLEIGLGGRYDSTSVLAADFFILNTIEKEHTHILGKTYEKIIFQKISHLNNAEILVSFFNKRFKKTIENINNKKNRIEFIEKKNIINLNKIKTDKAVYYLNKQYNIYEINNIYLAIKTVEKIISKKIIFDLKKYKNLKYRFSYLRKNRKTIIFNGAHTETSIKFNFQFLRKNSKNLIIVFSCLEDKAMERMLYLLSNIKKDIYISQINHHRAANVWEIYKKATKIFKKVSILNNEKQIRKLLHKKEEYIYICGSMYICEKIEKIIEK